MCGRDRRRTIRWPPTPRLREVAALVGEGATNAAIARRTGLTLDTVTKYVSQILERTGCANRTEPALPAVRPQRRDDCTATGRHSQATGRQ